MGQNGKISWNAKALIANVPNSEGNSGNFLFGKYMKWKLLHQIHGLLAKILPMVTTNYVTKNRFD